MQLSLKTQRGFLLSLKISPKFLLGIVALVKVLLFLSN